MQQYADIYLLLNYSACFGHPSRPSSGVHKTVVAFSVQIIQSGEQASSNVTKKSLFRHVCACLLPRLYDLYQKLQLQFYVLLMMGVMDARNIYNNLAVNKYLHTVASRWISSS